MIFILSNYSYKKPLDYVITWHNLEVFLKLIECFRKEKEEPPDQGKVLPTQIRAKALTTHYYDKIIF